jgi:ectoine hydroxylase-related dioxygenase (phytanoyl-CoA dioxygenase family)
MSVPIPVFAADDSTAAIGDALDEAGCVVVTGLLDADDRDRIRSDLAPGMAKAQVLDDDDPEDFYPARTRRMSALLAHSEEVCDQVVAHDLSIELSDRFLLPNGEFGYQVHVSAALDVGPGARAQVLHRDDSSFTFFASPRPDLIVASMWAISDFRVDNGATLLVPGSHRWPAEREQEPDEIRPAEMPAGSVLFWFGGTLHGAGPNTSNDWRYGVIMAYSVGWVRQEENQYMHISRERYAQLTPQLQKLAGFPMYRALGFYDPRITANSA